MKVPLAIPTRFGGRRWLLEIFKFQEASERCIRHAVWLDQRNDTWHWWCCCGASCQPSDVVTALTLARLHHDEIAASVAHEHSPCVVEHLLALWQRKTDEPDNVVIAESARMVTRGGKTYPGI